MSNTKPTKTLANIITTYLKPLSEQLNKPVDSLITPDRLITLAYLFDENKVNNQGLQKALQMIAEDDSGDDTDIETLLKNNNLLQISNTAVLEEMVERVIVENPEPVADYKGGKEQSIGFLIGQCMKASKGSGNPKVFRDLLIQKLND